MAAGKRVRSEEPRFHPPAYALWICASVLSRSPPPVRNSLLGRMERVTELSRDFSLFIFAQMGIQKFLSRETSRQKPRPIPYRNVIARFPHAHRLWMETAFLRDLGRSAMVFNEVLHSVHGHYHTQIVALRKGIEYTDCDIRATLCNSLRRNTDCVLFRLP